MLYYVPWPSHWIYECSIKECRAKITRGTLEEIKDAQSEHDQEHACNPRRLADVTVGWVPDTEISGLQSVIVMAGENVQEGLPL